MYDDGFIIYALKRHGTPLLTVKEINLKSDLDYTRACIFADMVALYDNGTLVGVELKDWKRKTYPRLAKEYLKTYREVCDYFYLASNGFSEGVFKVEEVGLFDLKKKRVVKKASYLHPSTKLRCDMINRLKGLFTEGMDSRRDALPLLLHPFQKTLNSIDTLECE